MPMLVDVTTVNAAACYSNEVPNFCVKGLSVVGEKGCLH